MRPVINVSGIDKCISFGDLISTNVSQAIEKETELGARQVQKREKSLAPVKSGLLVFSQAKFRKKSCKNPKFTFRKSEKNRGSFLPHEGMFHAVAFPFKQ